MKLKFFTSLILLTVLVSSCTPLFSAKNEEAPNIEQKVSKLVEDWRQLSSVDTALIAIESPDLGKMVIISGGLTQGDPLEFSQDTPFSIYSINKTFIAAEILSLEQDGTLSLNDPISKYLPTLPFSDEISIFNLLNHTSGYSDYIYGHEFQLAVAGNLSREWTIDESLSYLGKELLFFPGDQFHYSSANFTILGRIIEAVTQKSLQDELNERFFEPLGLDHTYVTQKGSPEEYLNGYHQCDRLPIEVQEYIDTSLGNLESCDDNLFAFTKIPHRAAESTDYEMISNLDNLITWSKNLYSGNILGPKQTTIMTTVIAESGYYGLGTMKKETPLGTFYGHTGGGFGQARMWYSPEMDLSIAGWVSLEGQPDFTWLTDKIFAMLSGDEVVVPLNIKDQIVSLQNENADVRIESANQLGQMGEDAEDAIPALIDMMNSDPVSSAQAAAARALSFIGQSSPSEKDLIFSALDEKLHGDLDIEVKKAIILAIGFIRHENSQEILGPFLNNPNPEIAQAANTAYQFASGTP